MSAEKCGTAITMEMFQEAVRQFSEPKELPPVIVSARAYAMLKKIQIRYPEFSPFFEGEIWLKAYKMGLVDE